jgi:hypothetical protein
VVSTKLAVICLSVLTSLSLWFVPQGTPVAVCRGKPLPIRMLPPPGVKVTGPSLPLRFGGTREFPRLHFPSVTGFRQVIKNRDEFINFWKQFTARIIDWEPPLPEVDFSKEMVVVTAMGQRPSLRYWTGIDGACEVDGQVDVFVSNVDEPSCGDGGLYLDSPGSPVDVVIIPRTDLPVVFHQTQVSCTEWRNLLQRLSRPN